MMARGRRTDHSSRNPSKPSRSACRRSTAIGSARTSTPRRRHARPRASWFTAGWVIRAARYRRFASFLAASGIPTLLYDYRGIGASRPRSLVGFRAGVEDWAEYDCAGAIVWLRSRYPDAEMVAIAHSFGALLVGGAPIHRAGPAVLVAGHTLAITATITRATGYR